MDPDSVPAAPASESPAPAVEPASPGKAFSPGCCGVAVARELKNEDTELADISGVMETKVVGAGKEAEVMKY